MLLLFYVIMDRQVSLSQINESELHYCGYNGYYIDYYCPKVGTAKLL